MTWKVYGCLNFSTGYSRRGEIYGPLPCKRWVPDGKKYRVRHRVRAAYVSALDKDARRKRDERRALEYARWIARRDGLTIPALKTKVIWCGIYSAHETRNVRHWSGVKTQAAHFDRIRAVAWGCDHRVYNIRKDGSRGAYLYTEFRPEFTIELPHWDWEPAEPVETIEYLQAAE